MLARWYVYVETSVGKHVRKNRAKVSVLQPMICRCLPAKCRCDLRFESNTNVENIEHRDGTAVGADSVKLDR